MKKIKNYKDFIDNSVNEEEEGWKDLAVGAAMAASTLIPSQLSAQNRGIDIKLPGKTTTQTYHKKVTDQEMSDKLQNRGYSLDSTTVDTIWRTVTEKAPNSPVDTIEVRFSDNQYFASGVYSISPEMADSINQTVDYIISSDNDILGVSIESSTDKQGLSTNLQKELKSKGYEPNNKGLAQARCESISEYLVKEKGISESLIDTLNQVEMGAGVQDPTARYVTVKIVYMKKEITRAADIIKQVPELKTTYYLSKEVTSKKVHHLRIKFPHIKIKHHRGRIKHYKNITKCFEF